MADRGGMRPILGDTVGDFGDGQAVPIECYSASPKKTMAPTDNSGAAGAATYRIASYCACAVGLVILYVALRETTWQGTRGLHTTMEVAATLLSLVVGALALVHYYSRKNNTYLFIGTGFLGTAFLDAYHAVVTSEFISPYLPSDLPSDLPSLIPWSWIASRQFLSIMLFISWLAWLHEQRHGEAGRVRERTVFTLSGTLTLGSFAVFALVPLPRAYYPEFVFHRPEELGPALFFLLALAGYLHKGEWRRDSFEHWLILALIVGVVGQAAFMSFSGRLFDLEFDAAHLLKKVSYLCVLIGLFISVHATFRQSESTRKYLEIQGSELAAQAEQLSHAREHAEAASRAKSDFLASMSHEIRTPMNGVLGAASLLLNSDLPPDQREYADMIKESGESLLTLLNDILDLSKVEAGRVELELLDFDLRGLFVTVEALWHSRLQSKGLKFSIVIASDIVPVLRSDPTRINQILSNLIGNASKFTETGGVTIDVSQIRSSNGQLETRFEVTDTGIGIAPQATSSIFTKFAQADGSTTRKYGGTGLGLAICKQLTQLLGGEIGFESIERSGSTFWFTIRCAPGDPKSVDADFLNREVDAFQPGGPVRSLNILVAEDNVVNQAVIRALLEKAGHRVDVVGNGAEAVGAVVRVPYDLVMMDIQMPEMDGITATGRIRDLPGETGKLPIIALTANAMKGDRERFLAAGMTDYVPKPINPNELMMVIARWGGAAARVDDDRDHRSDGPASVDETPVVDPDVLDALSEAVGEDMMRDLVGRGVGDVRASIVRIVELGNRADLEALRREAHDPKSTSGGFGAMRLHRLAQAIDLACKEDREQDARQLLTTIVPVAEAAFAALEARYAPGSADEEHRIAGPPACR